MRQGLGRPAPAMAVALLALFAALCGGVYAAAKIDGRTIRVKSLPGNRVKPGSLPANRLRPGVLEARLPATITGSQIDERSLGQVPSASYADFAATAQTATDAQTAVNAVNAVNAETVNGHGAGCLAGTQPFAGACWQSSASTASATAPVAAAACAAQGGTLPEALELAAFAQQPGVNLDPGGEWSGDIPAYSGSGTYAVITVTPSGGINSHPSTDALHYRCVIPLVI